VKLRGGKAFPGFRGSFAVDGFALVLLKFGVPRIPESELPVRHICIDVVLQKLRYAFLGVKSAVGGEHCFIKDRQLPVYRLEGFLHRLNHRLEVTRFSPVGKDMPSANAWASTTIWCLSSTVARPLYPWITPWLPGIFALWLSVMLLFTGFPDTPIRSSCPESHSRIFFAFS